MLVLTGTIPVSEAKVSNDLTISIQQEKKTQNKNFRIQIHAPATKRHYLHVTQQSTFFFFLLFHFVYLYLLEIKSWSSCTPGKLSQPQSYNNLIVYNAPSLQTSPRDHARGDNQCGSAVVLPWPGDWRSLEANVTQESKISLQSLNWNKPVHV